MFDEQDLEETERRGNGDGDPADPADALEADLRKLQDERDGLFEQLARVTADFRNAQRRLEQDKQQAIQYANVNLLKGLLPILDNFERALQVDPEKTDVNTLHKGVRMVQDQLNKLLSAQNVTVIAPEPGTPFNPNEHEALMQQPSDEYDEPTVTQLLQKGYMLNDRVIRPAQVAVSRTT
jgi:molecular chaperone GrpE